MLTSLTLRKLTLFINYIQIVVTYETQGTIDRVQKILFSIKSKNELSCLIQGISIKFNYCFYLAQTLSDLCLLHILEAIRINIVLTVLNLN